MNNLKVKKITHEDLGVTEDEFNNMLIDIFTANKKNDEYLKEKGVLSPVAGLPVTITITKDNHNKP